MKRKRSRDDVIMPAEPPYELMRWLAGDPLLLAASDEQSIREHYAEFRERVKAVQESK